MIVHLLQALLVALLIGLGVAWAKYYRDMSEKPGASAPSLGLGAIVNFFDTLGIGSFAPSTAAIKFFKLTDDALIPGTLNVGHSIPTIFQALIYISVVKVDVALLVSCIGASVAGALLGARVVSRMPVRQIRLGMGVALLIAAGLFAARNLNLLPAGGAALALTGGLFALAVALHFFFGALMTLGVGLYAPSLITLSMFGMDPRAAFPIMMGACAFLMPASSFEFIRARRFDPKIALAFTIAGVPAVLLAAFIVKEMPLDLLRWLVIAATLTAALLMINSAREAPPAEATKSGARA